MAKRLTIGNHKQKIVLDLKDFVRLIRGETVKILTNPIRGEDGHWRRLMVVIVLEDIGFHAMVEQIQSAANDASFGRLHCNG